MSPCFGRCCGCNPTTTTATIRLTPLCSGGPTVVGAVVTVDGVGSCTVTTGGSGGGQCSIGITKNGTYNFTVSVSGYCDASGSFTVSGCTSVLKFVTLIPRSISFQVFGCNSNPVENATVTTSEGSWTTDASGLATIDVPCAASFDVTVSKTRFVTQTTTVTQGAGMCTASVTLLPAAGFVCSTTCADPLPETLTLTDSIAGTCTLTWDSTSSCYLGTLAFQSIPVPDPNPDPDPNCLGTCPSAMTTLRYTFCGTTLPWGLGVAYDGDGIGLCCPGTTTQSCGCGFNDPGSQVCPPTFLATFATHANCVVYGCAKATYTITE